MCPRSTCRRQEKLSETSEDSLFTTIAICTSPSRPALRGNLLSRAGKGLPSLNLGLRSVNVLESGPGPRGTPDILRAVCPERCRPKRLVRDVLGGRPRSVGCRDGVLVRRGIDAVRDPQVPHGLNVSTACRSLSVSNVLGRSAMVRLVRDRAGKRTRQSRASRSRPIECVLSSGY